MSDFRYITTKQAVLAYLRIYGPTKPTPLRRGASSLLRFCVSNDDLWIALRALANEGLVSTGEVCGAWQANKSLRTMSEVI